MPWNSYIIYVTKSIIRGQYNNPLERDTEMQLNNFIKIYIIVPYLGDKGE